MGTNYYLVQDACECCGRGADEIHIGKSSGGWCFALHVYPEGWYEPKIMTLSAWELAWSQPKTKIRDEYDKDVSPQEMLKIITERKWESPIKWTDHDYALNDAEPGPNGLVRSRIDNRHCIGHGDGTYDLIIGEFS